MHNKSSAPGAVIQTIVQREKVSAVLAEDEKPVLAADLNASGKNIKNANDIETKTINGVDLLSSFSNALSALQSFCNKTFAHLRHSHPEFAGLKKELGDAVAALQPKGSFALLGHKHSATEIDALDERIKGVIDTYDVPAHSHDELEKDVTSLQKSIDTLTTKKEAQLSADALQSALQLQKETLKEHDGYIVSLSKQISLLEGKMKNQKVEIYIKEADKEMKTTVIEMDEPYIQMEKIPADGEIEVFDSEGKRLETRYVGQGKAALLAFMGGKSPYKMIIRI